MAKLTPKAAAQFVAMMKLARQKKTGAGAPPAAAVPPPASGAAPPAMPPKKAAPLLAISRPGSKGGFKPPMLMMTPTKGK